MKGTKNPISIIKTRKYRKKNNKIGKFPYSGLEVFMGGQGKGKTISAEKLIIERLEKYPKAEFITNVEIKGIKNKTIYFRSSEELVEILKKEIIPEQREGYLIFIDEIHVVLAELFRKNRPNIFDFSIATKKIKYKYSRYISNV